MSDVDTATTAIREAIARERQRRNVGSNQELARELGILPKHLSRWQNGRFTRLDRILVQLLLSEQDHIPSIS